MSQRHTDRRVVQVAIAFRSRGGSRPVRLLSGDKPLRPGTDTELPVIAVRDGKGVRR